MDLKKHYFYNLPSENYKLHHPIATVKTYLDKKMSSVFFIP